MRPFLSIVQIIQVQDIPYTLNGKRVEVPVKKVSLSPKSDATTCLTCTTFPCLDNDRVHVHVNGQIINGTPITSVNATTLRNPESLLEYERIGAMLCEEILRLP